MNERFDQLWAQALDAAVPETYSRLSDSQVLKIKQVFAELIVRDCASICELNGQSYKHSFTPAKARLAESTSNHCGLMIKRHFGVEE